MVKKSHRDYIFIVPSYWIISVHFVTSHEFYLVIMSSREFISSMFKVIKKGRIIDI